MLCNSIPKLVFDEGFSGISIYEKAIEISRKYKLLFHKFSACYSIFSSKNTMTAEILNELGMFYLIFFFFFLLLMSFSKRLEILLCL